MSSPEWTCSQVKILDLDFLDVPSSLDQAGSYLRFTDSCITQLKAQASRTCNESKEEEEFTRERESHGKLIYQTGCGLSLSRSVTLTHSLTLSLPVSLSLSLTHTRGLSWRRIFETRSTADILSLPSILSLGLGLGFRIKVVGLCGCAVVGFRV